MSDVLHRPIVGVAAIVVFLAITGAAVGVYSDLRKEKQVVASTHSELLGPPPDVQEAVSTVLKARAMWEPTQVENLPPHLPTTTGPAAQGLSEAQVCDFIEHPSAQIWLRLDVIVIIVLVAVLFIWTFRLHRAPGAPWRLALRVVPRREMGSQ